MPRWRLDLCRVVLFVWLPVCALCVFLGFRLLLGFCCLSSRPVSTQKADMSAKVVPLLRVPLASCLDFMPAYLFSQSVMAFAFAFMYSQ